jgi:glycine/serine hydroxymethyltransferase
LRFGEVNSTGGHLDFFLLREKQRRRTGIDLIAPENFTSRAVMEAISSPPEGMPEARYYGGNEFIDEFEELCRARALKACTSPPGASTCSPTLAPPPTPACFSLTPIFSTQ